jgi:exoribonuclease R
MGKQDTSNPTMTELNPKYLNFETDSVIISYDEKTQKVKIHSRQRKKTAEMLVDDLINSMMAAFAELGYSKQNISIGMFRHFVEGLESNDEFWIE